MGAKAIKQGSYDKRRSFEVFDGEYATMPPINISVLVVCRTFVT